MVSLKRRRLTNKDDERKNWGVLLVDIVNYSGLDGENQKAAIERLTEAVRTTDILRGVNFRRKDNPDHFFLPTGDGMIVGFKGGNESTVKLARQIHERYGDDRKKLKIGINCGSAVRYKDIRKDWNFAGSCINMAARVESCCNGGHILVAKEVGDDLLKLSENDYRPLFDGPFHFKVKWEKPVAAYNFFNKKRTFGNASKPERNRVFELDYVSLKQSLLNAGVDVSPRLSDPDFARRLDEHPVLGNAVLDFAFQGFTGVPPTQVIVTMTKKRRQLPPYVWEAKERIGPPKPNKNKVYIAEVWPPLSDQDDVLRLKLGFTDYWTFKAVAKSKEQIYSDIKDGKLDPFEFPRQLDCHLVVITADKKLVLGKRTGGVDASKNKWGASLGESIDGNEDSNTRGGLHPVNTIRRALREELGLGGEEVESAEIRILGLATEWETLTADLITLVRLKKTGVQEVRDAHKLSARDGKGEMRILDFVNFELDTCFPLMLSGSHTPEGSPALRAQIYGTSRVAILAAIAHQFKLDKVRSRLKTLGKR